MRFLRTALPVIALFLALTACKKDDDEAPAPAPVIAGYGPIANFSVSGGDCGAPCDVTFTNTSANSVSYTWDFGDNSPASTAATNTVTHTYTTPGTYTVTLTAKASNNTTSSKVIDVVITEPVAVNLLTDKSFKLTAAVTEFMGQQIDAMAFFPACNRDDLHKFNEGGEYVLTDAGVTCQPSSSTTGTWAYANNETQLIINSANSEQTFDIVSLTASQMVLRMPDGGFGAPVTLTFTPQ